MAKSGIAFTKMEGIGNDYIYVDARKRVPGGLAKLAREMSDRNYGVGSDGLILIRSSKLKGVKHRMQMFNSDGSESEMCGNGLRCVAKYLFDRKLEKADEFPIETGAGVLRVKVTSRNGSHIARKIRVNLGRPRLTRAEVPMQGPADAQCVDEPFEIEGHQFRITCLSMGNPHCVIFLDRPADKKLVHTIGPLIESHSMFPRRTNVHFVFRESAKLLHQRTWERGAGETLACGTGAASVCVAAVLNGLTGRKVRIKLLGGDLEMEWNAKNDCVYKTGPAREVYTGVWPA
jgi:diaminopimelate epimerase